MKKTLRDQQGFALVLVLLTITVIGIISAPLVGSVLNSAVQNQKSMENAQLTKLIDMGKVFARNSIIEEIPNLPSNSIANAIEKLRVSLPTQNVIIDDSSNNAQFSIVNYVYSQNNSQLDITYHVKAILDRQGGETVERTETETFTLMLSQADRSSIDWNYLQPADFVDQRKFPNQYTGSKVTFVNKEIKGNTHFKAEVEIRQDGNLNLFGSTVLQNKALLNNNSVFQVDSHFYATGGVLDMKNKSKLLINKDAWFKDIQIDSVNTICVKGKIKEWDIRGYVPYPQQISSCSRAGYGVFFEGEEFEDTGSPGEWRIIGTS